MKKGWNMDSDNIKELYLAQSNLLNQAAHNSL